LTAPFDWFVCYWLYISFHYRFSSTNPFVPPLLVKKRGNPTPFTRGHFLVGECCWHVAAAFYIFTSLTWFPPPNECRRERCESQKVDSFKRSKRVLKFKYLVTGRRNSIYAKQNHNPSIIHQAANGRNFIDTRQPASSDTDTTHLYLGGMRRRFSVLFGSYFFFAWGGGLSCRGFSLFLFTYFVTLVKLKSPAYKHFYFSRCSV